MYSNNNYRGNGGYQNNGYNNRQYNYGPNTMPANEPFKKVSPQFGDKDPGGVFSIGQRVMHVGSHEYCWICEFGRQQICVRTKDLRTEWMWPFELEPADND